MHAADLKQGYTSIVKRRGGGGGGGGEAGCEEITAY